MASVPAVWIGPFTADFPRDSDPAGGYDPSSGAPGSTVLRRVEQAEAEASDWWAVLGYVDGSGSFIVVDPALMGIDASGAAFYDPAGPAVGERAAVSVSASRHSSVVVVASA